MGQPIDLTQVLLQGQIACAAVGPIIITLVGMSFAIHLFTRLLHSMGITLIGDDLTEPEQQKRKNDDSPASTNYETHGEYIVKRKNDQPVSLGDDGELILPDNFQERME